MQALAEKHMRAVVIEQPGPPEALLVVQRPVAVPQPGWVSIRVKAFGLNRSELFTRRGDSPDVQFPRIPGIEAVGVVEAAPGGEFEKGQTVATAMGGMGRDFDGGYAQYTRVPAHQVRALDTRLDWARLAALPQMLQTAWGSLRRSLRIARGDSLLIRGATTSVGLAALALAKHAGLEVAASTRKTSRLAFLRGHGADAALVDEGDFSTKVKRVFPGGVDHVLELLGASTLRDSLRCVKPGGRVCMSGIVGGWTLERFSPLDDIPGSVQFTVYSGGARDFMATPLQRLVSEFETGEIDIPLGPVFGLDDIVEAHRLMEANQGLGKMVVRVD